MKTRYFAALDGFAATEDDSLGWQGANTRFMKGDVRRVHDEIRLEARTGNIWVVSGGDLAGQFHDVGVSSAQVCRDSVMR